MYFMRITVAQLNASIYVNKSKMVNVRISALRPRPKSYYRKHETDTDE